MSRTSARLLAGLVIGGAALAACSSAPAPDSLSLGPGGASGSPTAAADAGTTGTAGSATTGSGGIAGGTTGTGSGGTGGTGGTTGTTGGATGGTAGGTGGSTGGSPTDLFTPAQERTGITPTQITICAHAALTYAAAFNTSPDDLNVFWTALNAEKGGIYGRKVVETYEDDAYKPDQAKIAAATCESKGIFFLLGGIGFDQIPSVRNYAEEHHLLYIHHTATLNGTKGQRYSFSLVPTTERTGEGFAQLARQRFAGKKIGILKRDSANWEPGVVAFKAKAKEYGLSLIKPDEAVPQNAGDYSSQLQNLKNEGAQVVWIWLNALETTNVVQQMHAMNWTPDVMVFPFNLTSQTLGQQALNPVMAGVAMYPAYSFGDYTGPFASYQDDMKEFERQYKQYDPNAQISGVGGDLIFLNWVGQKALYRLLLACGKDCTRDSFVRLMTHTTKRVVSSGCPFDFSRDGHHGSDFVTFMQTYQSGNVATGKVNWRETNACVGSDR
jgi:ABC-type branched-subunit amino acid transport system substrate-binding protein